jgi:hypothetical protein
VAKSTKSKGASPVEIDIDFIRKDMSADKRVVEVYEKLNRYACKTVRADWLKERRDNWEQGIGNEIWDSKEKREMAEAGMIPLAKPNVAKGVQASCAIVTDKSPDVKFLPVGTGDLWVAELLKRGFDKVFAENEGQDEIYDFNEENEVGALSFMRVGLDKNYDIFGDVTIKEEPPDDVYFDHRSRERDFSDTDLIIAKQRDREYIATEYPDLDDDDIYFSQFSKPEDNTEEAITGGDNYAHQMETEGDIAGHVPEEDKKRQRVIWEIESYLLKTFHEDWIATLNKGGEPEYRQLEDGEKLEDVVNGTTVLHWPRTVVRRVLRIIVGKVLVEFPDPDDPDKMVKELVNPYGEDNRGRPVMPIIGLKGQRRLDKMPISRCTYALPLNKAANKREIQAIHAVSHGINAPIIEPDGSVRWVDAKGQDAAAGTPGTRGLVARNAAFQPTRLPGSTSQVASVLQLMAGNEAAIDDVFDIQDVVKGKLPEGQTQQVAARTVLALQDMAGVMSKPRIRRLESAMLRIAKSVIVMMLRYWPRYKWEALVEESERMKPPAALIAGKEDQVEPESVEYRAKWEQAIEKIRPADMSEPPGISLIDLDVRLFPGSSMPTNRLARATVALEEYKAGLRDRKSTLEMADDPKAQEIAETMDKREQQMAAAGMLKK